MSKQQRDSIDAGLRAAPFSLSQSTAEFRESYDAFQTRPYPADVAPAGLARYHLLPLPPRTAPSGAR
jgi:hypothetical protein